MTDLFTALALLAGAAVPTLLGMAAKAAVILGLTAVVAAAVRHRSASTRHLVWTIGTVAVLALPVLGVAAPRWSVPGPAPLRQIAEPGFDLQAIPAPAPDPVTVQRVSPEPAPAPMAHADHRREHRAVAAVAVTPPDVPAASPAPVPDVAAPVRYSLEFPRMLWLLPLWLLGTVIGLSLIADGVVRSARLARRAQPVRDARRRDLFMDLAADFALDRHVRLLETDGANMPMTWGTLRPVILLPAESVSWSNARLDAVLSHELAHVRRFDYLTQLLAQIMCAVYWFNPLTWLAAKRLREERELASDDAVLSSGTMASDYARHLLDVARELRVSPLPAAATVCMARRSSLRERLLAVLDAGRARAAVRKELVLPASLAALMVALPLSGAGLAGDDAPAPVADAVAIADAWADPPRAQAAPAPSPTPSVAVDERRGILGVVGRLLSKANRTDAPAQGCDWDTRSDHMSASHTSDDHRTEIRIRNGDCRLEIEYEGTVEFSADDTDVVRISRGGYFDLEVREGRTTRRLELRPGQNGLERKWLVNGDETPYDATARQWLADMLLVAFRRAGINAQARATRIFAQSGVEGLLQEISFIHSDWTAGRYYTVLLSQPDLDVETVQRLVRDAGQRIESDYELARLLIAVAEHQPVDEAVQAAYMEAAGSIQSDYEHRRVLSAILKRDNIGEPLASSMLRSAQRIGSDYERARLLIEVLEAHPLSDALTESFFDAVREIDSDFEQRRVLSTVLARGAPDITVLDRTLASASTIGSDHELAQLLLQVADLYPLDATLPQSYLDAARSLGSDFQRSRVLQTLLARDQLSPAGLAAVLEAAGSLTSDFEVGRILKAVAAGDTLHAVLRPAFFRALDGMESDHEFSTVLQTVLDHQPLDDELVSRILESALQIGSDHSLGQVLIKLVGAYTITDALEPAFRRALDRIESEHTRGRVLSARYPRGRPAE